VTAIYLAALCDDSINPDLKTTEGLAWWSIFGVPKKDLHGRVITLICQCLTPMLAYLLCISVYAHAYSRW